MNPHDNEIMQHNYLEMQRKKCIFFCLDFITTTQQNTVAYSCSENFQKQPPEVFCIKGVFL